MYLKKIKFDYNKKKCSTSIYILYNLSFIYIYILNNSIKKKIKKTNKIRIKKE